MGIGDDYRYHFRLFAPRVGDEAEKSLDHWAVSAGVWAIQARLIALGHLSERTDRQKGKFGLATKRALKRFQRLHNLWVDGTVGMSDAQALWLPVMLRAERRHEIPNHLLVGEMCHESAVDPGAVGYFIYYQVDDHLEYRGVDRGMGQINHVFNPQVSWREAYEPWTAIDWSGRRLRTMFVEFRADFPNRPVEMIWDAAVCAHNSPARARAWLENGQPSEEAAAYVAAVKAAVPEELT